MLLAQLLDVPVRAESVSIGFRLKVRSEQKRQKSLPLQTENELAELRDCALIV